MKTNICKNIFRLALVFSAGVALTVSAQQRFGGGGGFGGFGGFGGLGGARSSSSSSTSYNGNGQVGSAMISVDPETHNIVVIADKPTADQIQRVIESLDEAERQVLIKVVFLEVERNDDSIIGVQGSYTGGSLGGNISKALTGFTTNGFSTFINPTNGVASIIPTSISPTYANFSAANSFNLPQSLAGAAGNGGLYSVLGSDFTATLQAIASAGRSQVLSRPSVLAHDGQLAQIVVGQQIYLPSGVAYASVGTAGTTIPTINGSYQNVGIILNVTPFIGANGLVEMILNPETSEVDNSTPGQVITYGNSLLGSSPVYAPNIDVRSANTVVVTPDAQTVVIGGLISNTKSSADSKVPFLGDIPLLGQLFKTTSKADSKTELLMFLTPHIVQAPSQLSALTPTEMHNTLQMTNSVSEQELDRFLERVPVKKK